MSISCDPKDLVANALCMQCIPKGMRDEVIIYLLCQLANGGGGTCTFQEGAGSPVGSANPSFIGQLYHDTVADAYYRSTGLTAGDWVAIGGGASNVFQGRGTNAGAGLSLNTNTTDTSISFPDLTGVLGSLELYSFSVCTSVNLPVLGSVSGYIYLTDFPVLTTLSIPSLTNVFADLEIDDDTNPNLLLSSVSLQSLVTVQDVRMANNPVLKTFSAPNWVPTDGKTINVSGCALDSASVELILSRCVAAGVTTCTINLSGGTNAGLASLSAQGQADAATLGAQLTINP